MRVLCVTHDYSGKWSCFSATLMLTIGKWYDVIEEHDAYYTLDWRNGYKANLSKSYFKTVEEIREEKLNRLL